MLSFIRCIWFIRCLWVFISEFSLLQLVTIWGVRNYLYATENHIFLLLLLNSTIIWINLIVIMILYEYMNPNGWWWHKRDVWQELHFLNHAINSSSNSPFFSYYLSWSTKQLIVGRWGAIFSELSTSIEFYIFVNLEWINKLE